MKKKLYHATHIPNLEVLEPNVSTHGESYVYVTKDLTVALFFGSNKSMGDLDGPYGGGCDGRKPYFYEAYPGFFKRRFNVPGYVYEVDPTDFVEGKTSYKAELVSEKPVKILKCTKVDNLYETLLNLSKEGKLDLRFYEKDNPKYVEVINNHIKDRIIRYKILENKDSYKYRFCKDFFPEIVMELEAELNM